MSLHDDTAAILAKVRRSGGELWSDNGNLRCRAPKGTLSEHEVSYLKEHRSSIIERLQMGIGTEPNVKKLIARPVSDRLPLTFSQLAHWNRYGLATRRHLRQIASATRLQGVLDVAALRAGIAAVVRRHQALRTRIVTTDGIPEQIVLEHGQVDLAVVELEKPGSLRVPEGAWIKSHFAEQIDVTRDPLFSIVLAKEDQDRHLLLISMEHLVGDGASINIVLNEVLAAYAQLLAGHEISLPPLPIQYSDYALWQQEAGRSWMAERARYWQRRLADFPPARFPRREDLQSEPRTGWGMARVCIPREMKSDLVALSRRERTTLVITVLSAYVALLSRWCGLSSLVLEYVTDGRMVRGVENLVGYFAFHLYLCISAEESASLRELMATIAEEYSTAQEYADWGYADAHLPKRGCARTSAFNWVSGGARSEGMQSEATSCGQITHAPVPFEHPLLDLLEIDHEPKLVLYDSEGDVEGGVLYPRSRFCDDEMNRFADCLLETLKLLIDRPDARTKDVPIL